MAIASATSRTGDHHRLALYKRGLYIYLLFHYACYERKLLGKEDGAATLNVFLFNFRFRRSLDNE